ncbi:MAG: hypothetical protein AAF918_13550 [Pseudomonadota bacterium]
MSDLAHLLPFFNGLLLCRMVYLRQDGPLGSRRNAVLLLVQGAGIWLLYGLSTATIALSLVVLGAAGLNLLFEQRWFDLARGWRSLTLFFTLLGATLVATLLGNLSLAPGVESAATFFAAHVPLFPTSLTAAAFGLLLFGLLMLANETNIVIRAVFHYLRLEPTPSEPLEARDPKLVSISADDYRAGRAIGILERWLVYLVVVSGSDLTAIGFILAAKGLVRFKRLERDNADRFAEYLLIGTLLSTLCALLIGTWVRELLLAL